jgi:hypothetical protein
MEAAIHVEEIEGLFFAMGPDREAELLLRMTCFGLASVWNGERAARPLRLKQ